MPDLTDEPEGYLIPPVLVSGIEKLYATQIVSRQMIDPDPPTEAQREASRERKRQAWRLYDAARPALAAITDPLARAILDLHAAAEIEWPKCQGCDLDGYEVEEPTWPCRTVQVVAARFGIELPDGSYLWSRP